MKDSNFCLHLNQSPVVARHRRTPMTKRRKSTSPLRSGSQFKRSDQRLLNEARQLPEEEEVEFAEEEAEVYKDLERRVANVVRRAVNVERASDRSNALGCRMLTSIIKINCFLLSYIFFLHVIVMFQARWACLYMAIHSIETSSLAIVNLLFLRSDAI